MKKPAIFRIFAVLGLIAAALSFQNCGPTFVTNEQGQIQYSRFDSTQSSLSATNSPSVTRNDFPRAVSAKR